MYVQAIGSTATVSQVQACQATTSSGDRSPTYKALAEHRVAIALEQAARCGSHSGLAAREFETADASVRSNRRLPEVYSAYGTQRRVCALSDEQLEVRVREQTTAACTEQLADQDVSVDDQAHSGGPAQVQRRAQGLLIQ